MSALAMESRNRQEELESYRAEEEDCRRRLVTLRDGIQNVLREHGTEAGPGVSTEDLLASVAELCGKPRPASSDQPDASWKSKYETAVRSIGSLLGNGPYGASTDPHEVVNAVQSWKA